MNNNEILKIAELKLKWEQRTDELISLKEMIGRYERSFKREKSIEALKQIHQYLKTGFDKRDELDDEIEAISKTLRPACSHQVIYGNICDYECPICKTKFNYTEIPTTTKWLVTNCDDMDDRVDDIVLGASSEEEANKKLLEFFQNEQGVHVKAMGMHKETIRKILEAKRVLSEYNASECVDHPFHNFEWSYDSDRERVPKKEEDWFPNIEELNDAFDALKSEIRDVLKQKNEAKDFLKHLNCPHPVRIRNYDGFKWRFEDRCVLCGERFIDNTFTEKTALFIGREIEDEEGVSRVYYTEKDIDKQLEEIINQHAGSEINIVYEIECLKLEKCVICNPKTKKLSKEG